MRGWLVGSGIGVVLALGSAGLSAADLNLEVLVNSYPIPAENRAAVQILSHLGYDVRCDLALTALIRGRYHERDVTSRWASAPVLGYVLKAGRVHERSFDYTASVEKMRKAWEDPDAIVSEIDAASLASSCTRIAENPPPPPTQPAPPPAQQPLLHAKGYLHGAGEYQYYPQYLQRGSYVFTTAGPLDTLLTLLDAQGRPVAQDDDHGSGRNARLEIEISDDGPYQLKVAAFGHGSYELFGYRIF